MRNALFAFVAVLTAALGFAQNPQTTTAPLYAVNAKYVNGVAPGYWPTQQSIPNGSGGTITAATGLNINLGPGTANCGAGTIITYAGGTFSLSASATNRVYLDTTSNCAPAVKTSPFTSTDIPLALIVTGGSSITTLTDVRTSFSVPPTNGGGGALNGQVVTTDWNVTPGVTYDYQGTTTQTATLPNSIVTGFFSPVVNDGTGAVTIASAGPTIHGPTSIPAGQQAYIFTDGTAYYVSHVSPGTGGGGFTPSPVAGYTMMFAGDSRDLENAPEYTATAASCNGTTCTVTATNTLAASTWVELGAGFSPTCMAPATTSLTVPVTSATSSQFVFAESSTTCSGSVSGTGGTARNATWYWPTLSLSKQPALAGYGSSYIFNFSGQTVDTVISDYNTLMHPHSPVVTGIPGYFFLNAGTNNLLNGDSAGTLETKYQTLWATLRTDGWIIVQTTLFVGRAQASFTPDARRVYYNFSAVDQWLRGQSYHNDPSDSIGTSTTWWDKLLDFQPYFSEWTDTWLWQGDQVHLNQNGARIESAIVNEAFLSHNGKPLGQIDSYGKKVKLCGYASGVGWVNADCEQFYGQGADGTPNIDDMTFGMFPSGSGFIPYWKYNNIFLMMFHKDSSDNVRVDFKSCIGLGSDVNAGANGGFCYGFAPGWSRVSSDGSNNANGGLEVASLLGPSTAPTGSCSPNGKWVLSQDGAITKCSAGTYVTFSAGATLTSSAIQYATSPTATRAATARDVSGLEYSPDTGAADVYVVTLAPAITSVADGLVVRFLPSAANATTTPTLAVNGLTAAVITKNGATALVANDLTATAVAVVIRKGTGWQLQNPQTGAVAVTVSGTSPIVVNHTGNNYDASCPTCSVGSGTAVKNNGGSTLGTSDQTGLMPYLCADSSGSGTAQTCTSSPAFTVTAGNCWSYTTTTSNSGTGLTLNPNTLGAKSVAIPGASGWTTTLTAGIIPANKPLVMCYDGTNLNIVQTGTTAGGGAGSAITLTASASASLDFTGANACLSSSYKNYQIDFNDMVFSADNVSLLLQFSHDGGSTWDTTTSHYLFGQTYTNINGGDNGQQGGASSAGMPVSGGAVYANTGPKFVAFGRYANPNSTGVQLFEDTATEAANNATTYYTKQVRATYFGAQTINAMRAILSSGTITSGTVTCRPLAQ